MYRFVGGPPWGGLAAFSWHPPQLGPLRTVGNSDWGPHGVRATFSDVNESFACFKRRKFTPWVTRSLFCFSVSV
jgi:hypothetical protein